MTDEAGTPIVRDDMLDHPAQLPEGRSVLARTAHGMGWIVGWRMATRVLGLCNTLILVRLLAPGDFGLVALGTSFALAVDAVSDLGVEDALVREHAPPRSVYDTAFTMNALRAVLTALLLAAVAAPIGAFFKQPRLATVLLALAIGVLVGGVENIGIVDFRRAMAFDKEFRLQVVPRLLSIVVTVAAAFAWRSYWALVAGIVASRTTRTLFSYRMHPYRPRPTLRDWRRLIVFSAWTTSLGIVGLVRDRMDAFVIGRVLSPTAVGIFSIGEEVAALPTSELVMPLTRATFSGFTAARHAGQSMAEPYSRAVAATFLLTFPAGLGIALVAEPLVAFAVGAKWMGAVPVIRIMGLVGAFSVFGVIAGVLFSVHGLLRRQFTVTVTCMVLRLAALVPLVHRFGIVGAAIGALLGMAAEHAWLVATAFARFRLGYRALARRIWRILLAGGAMAAVLVASGLVSAGGGTIWVRLFGAACMGAMVYLGVLAAAWLLAGRPPGAEADMLSLCAGVLRRVLKTRSRA